MGIITKEVEVKINPMNASYYEKIGYKIPMKKATESTRKKYKRDYVYDFEKTILVKIEDLPLKSNVEIEAVCDYCNKNIIKMKYSKYNNSLRIVDKIACKECSGKKYKDVCLTKYGVSSTSQLSEVKNKIKNTSRDRYGVDNYAKTKECQEKMEATMNSRYGVKRALQRSEGKESFINTCIFRYGEEYGKIFYEKAKKTFKEKTGYDYPSQSPEVRRKVMESYHLNNSQMTSCQQCYIYNLYLTENSLIELNYPISYYSADICFIEEKIIFEYDGGFHDGRVKLGKMTQEEFDHKELIRDQVIKREGYKIIRLISRNDYLPSDEILLQLLSHSREYFSKTSHTWICWDIDNSKMINAENKDSDGVFFNFGQLRRIKKSDHQEETTILETA